MCVQWLWFFSLVHICKPSFWLGESSRMNFILHPKAHKLTFFFLYWLQEGRPCPPTGFETQAHPMGWEAGHTDWHLASFFTFPNQMPARFYTQSTSFTNIIVNDPLMAQICFYISALQSKDLNLFGIFKPKIVLQKFVFLSPFEGSPTQLFMDSAKAIS